MAIYWPTPRFKGRTFKFCVLTRQDFNLCVRSSPLRGRVSKKRAESTGECVNFKTVKEIRRSSARDTCIKKSVYFVLNSQWNWKPVERLKQRSDVVRFTCVFFPSGWDEQHSSECAEGYGKRKQEDQKGEHYSGQGVTERVRWPVSLWSHWKDTSRQNWFGEAGSVWIWRFD